MIALIDGDVLCHLACPPTNIKEIGDEEVAFHSLDSNGERAVVQRSKEANRRYMERAWKNFEFKVDKLKETLFCDDVMIAVKGDDNFRDMLYPDYKASRRTEKAKKYMNPFVKTVRQLSIVQGVAIPAHGREADDLVRIWAEECRQIGEDFIVCSIDKDLKAIGGKYYNLREERLYTISEDEATRLFYEQLLKGDPVDDIPGVPGIGDKTATKLLAKAKTEEEFQEIIVSNYIAAYEDDWKTFLLVNGRLLYIQKTVDDFFSIEHWPIVQELS